LSFRSLVDSSTKKEFSKYSFLILTSSFPLIDSPYKIQVLVSIHFFILTFFLCLLDLLSIALQKENSVSIHFDTYLFFFSDQFVLQNASFGKYSFFHTYLFSLSFRSPVDSSTKREFGKYSFWYLSLLFFQSICSTKCKFW
jgi:hypothetical protein